MNRAHNYFLIPKEFQIILALNSYGKSVRQSPEITPGLEGGAKPQFGGQERGTLMFDDGKWPRRAVLVLSGSLTVTRLTWWERASVPPPRPCRC